MSGAIPPLIQISLRTETSHQIAVRPAGNTTFLGLLQTVLMYRRTERRRKGHQGRYAAKMSALWRAVRP